MASNLFVLNQYVTSCTRDDCGVAFGVRSRTVTCPGCRRGGPSATGTVCPHPYGGHGFVAPTYGPGDPGLDTVFHSADCPGSTQCFPTQYD